MAKLVEILARELVDWPEGVRRIEQDNNGLTLFEPQPPRILAEFVSEIAEDSYTAIVTRAEWQAAVDALKAKVAPAWDGVGLPPVGILVEASSGAETNLVQKTITSHSVKWEKVKVIAHGISDGNEVAISQGDDFLHVGNDFRPIRTPEQIAAEEREKELQQIEDTISFTVGRDSRRYAAEAIYDAGYRKQEPK